MDFGIADRCALVLGAGGGLGGAIAHSLAAEGANVVVADIDGDAAKRTAASIESSGGKAIALQWDLADLSGIDCNVAEIEGRFGHVSILVNNTGGPPPTTVAGQAPEQWSKFFQSMVLSVIALTDRVLPNMRSAGWGRIITSTSSGVVAPPVERTEVDAGRLVENPGAGRGRGRNHEQHRSSRAHCHLADHVPRRTEGKAPRPDRGRGCSRERRIHPRRTVRHAPGVRRRCRISGKREVVLRHGQHHSRRRRDDRQHLTTGHWKGSPNGYR